MHGHVRRCRSATVPPSPRQERGPHPPGPGAQAQVEAGRLHLVGSRTASSARDRARRRSGPRSSGRAGCRSGAGHAARDTRRGERASGKRALDPNGARAPCMHAPLRAIARGDARMTDRPERLGNRHAAGARRPRRARRYGETAEALYLTQSFVYDSAEAADARFAGDRARLHLFALRQSRPCRCSRSAWRCSRAPRPAAPPPRAWRRSTWP